MNERLYRASRLTGIHHAWMGFLVSVAGWGLTAGLTGLLVARFLCARPMLTGTGEGLIAWLVLGGMFSLAAFFSARVGGIRRRLNRARAQEAELLWLFELSNVLAQARDEPAALHSLADKIIDTLLADRIEISVENGAAPLQVQRGMKMTRKPDAIAPLQAARGLWGEIRLWRTHPPLLPEEARMLQTLANQGVLAIERLRLTHAEQRARVLEESDRLKSSLLSSVSHELRTPLSALKASVSSLRSGEIAWDSTARAELLTTMEEEIDHLNTLVGNLLDMSRIEAGVLKPNQKPNLLVEIVEAVLARLRLHTQNHRIEVEVRDDLPFVYVDFVQIEQVFTNLLTNSLKYSPPGSTIRISAWPRDERFLLVQLSNQSLPIPEEDLERIFEKFYRINPSERVTGSGLGLSIAKGLVEAHGGRIWAENCPDGLAFFFTLPLWQPGAAAQG